MALFYDVAEALAEADLEHALERTLALVAESLQLDAAWIWLLDQDSNKFYLAGAYDLPPYLREPPHMTGDPCWCMEAFFDGDFISRNVDIISCSRLQEGIEEQGPGATRGLRAHASIALRFGSRELGLLNAARALNSSLSAAELETLTTIGAQIGVAVERARLAERAAAAARAEERASLSRELHDTVLQDMTAIALHLESAERKASSDPSVARERIATALAISRDALEQLRHGVEGLREDPLGGEPLVTAVSSLARRFTSETGVQTALHGWNGEARLPHDVEFAAYRIVSEALANVRRHAKARRVDLRFGRLEEAAVFEVSDDGLGFDTAADSAGLGLRGMQERANELGGSLHVRSQRGAGTSVEARFPLEKR
jgi:signal transduction histidine kinase